MHALLVGHYLNGAAYPVGGSSRIAATILPGIERAGGAVVTSAEVARIVVEDGRARGVRLASGEELRAPLVISDAGVALTFGPLLAPEVAARAGVAPTVPGAAPSFAHVSLYVGLRHDAAALGLTAREPLDLPGPRSRPQRRALRRRSGRAAAGDVPVVPVGEGSRLRPPLPRPRDDRGDRRRALGVVRALAGPAVEEARRRLRGAQAAALRAPARRRSTRSARRSRARSITSSCRRRSPPATSPATRTARSTASRTRPARFAARQLRPHTPIAGLYLTGADICTAGVGGALMGGVLTAAAITRKNLIAAILGDRSKRGTIAA